MKTLLKLSGVLLLVAQFAQPASAVEVYKSKNLNLDIYGDISAAIFVGKQDSFLDSDNLNPNDPDGFDAPSPSQFRGDGRLGVDAYSILANGYKVGALAEIELSAKIEDFYIYMSGPFGDLRVGQAANASVSLQSYVPEFLAPAIDTIDWTDFQFYGRSSVADGLQPGDATYLLYDDIAFTVTYFSPAIQGFQFGASWTPDPCSNFDNSHSTSVRGRGKNPNDETCGATYIITDVVTIATKFTRQESFGLAWGVSGSYLTGNRHEPNNSPYAYNVGMNLAYAGFEVGGTWQNSRNLNKSNQEDRVWTIGYSYTHKPKRGKSWRIGTAYRQSRRDQGQTDARKPTRINKEIEGGLSYELGNGLWSSLFFEYVIDKNPAPEESDLKPRRFTSYGGGIILTFQF